LEEVQNLKANQILTRTPHREAQEDVGLQLTPRPFRNSRAWIQISPRAQKPAAGSSISPVPRGGNFNKKYRKNEALNSRPQGAKDVHVPLSHFCVCEFSCT